MARPWLADDLSRFRGSVKRAWDSEATGDSEEPATTTKVIAIGTQQRNQDGRHTSKDDPRRTSKGSNREKLSADELARRNDMEGATQKLIAEGMLDAPSVLRQTPSSRLLRRVSAATVDSEALIDALPVKKPKTYVQEQAMVDTPRFILAMAGIVVVNMVTVGLETDYDDIAPRMFGTLNTAFLLVYFMELCGRLLAHGLLALKDKITNLDAVLLLLSLVGRTALGNRVGVVSSLPVVRLLRMLRLLGSMHWLSTQRELQLLLQGAAGTSATLIWVGCSLFLLLWSAATFAYQVFGESAAWNEFRDPLEEYEPFQAFDNREYFGSVWRSFLSLFQVVTLSQWADQIARPIVAVYPITFAFFTLFPFATAYGLLMFVISNVVSKSITASKGVEMSKNLAMRQERERLAEIGYQVFSRLDRNGDGKITEYELSLSLQDPLLGDVLELLEVPILEAEHMIRMFDYDGTGVITYYKLLRGMLSMGDPIDQKDWIMVSIRAWSLLQRTRKLEEKLSDISEQIHYAARLLKGATQSMRQALENKGNVEARNQMMEAVRTAQTPVLTLVGARKKGSLMDQGAEFVSFAQRFVGGALSPTSPVSPPQYSPASPPAAAPSSHLTSPQRHQASSLPSPGSGPAVSPSGHLAAPPLHQAWSTYSSPLRSTALGDHASPTARSEVAELDDGLASLLQQRATVAAVCCGKGRLGDPPRRLEVEQEGAMRLERKLDQDPYKPLDGRPSPKVSHYKDLLG